MSGFVTQSDVTKVVFKTPYLSLQMWTSAMPAGNVHCLACGKGLKDHATLAQHLKDKHHNSSSADAATARGGFNLGDLMAQAQAKRAAAAAAAAVQPPAERHQKQYSAFTPGDARGMREYLKVRHPAAFCLCR